MDKIILENIEIFANHGLFKEEKVLGQKFILSLELDLNIKKCATTGDLTQSVHYGELCHRVEALFTECSIDLLETVVDKITKFILNEYPIVKKVKAELKKPWAPIGRHLDYAAVQMTRERHTAYLSLGSNMGEKEKFLKDAINKIDSLANVKVVVKSSFLETEPWGYEDQDTFLNVAIGVETILEPYELMEELLKIESELGRIREVKWGPRVIDIDIILMDEIISNDPNIILPHPFAHQREFVLAPLNEIAPYALHPLMNMRVSEILQKLVNK